MVDLSGLPRLAAFQQAHPDFDILSADLLHHDTVAALDTQGVADPEPLELLKSYQRLLRIEPDTAVADQLLGQGIDSAQKLTSVSRTQFVQNVGGTLPGGAEQADRVYSSALGVKSRAMHLAANVHGVAASPAFQAMNVNHISPELTSYFQSLSSYAEMFGSLDYCSCSECSSIFGPAAYLVDLLRIIDLAITVPNTTRPDKATVAAARAKYDQGGLAGLSDAEQRTLFQLNIPPGLSLNERRPDLGNIELTCANTNDLIPYLQIVNGVLEQTVTAALRAGNTLRGNDLYLTLANSFYPFNSPFNLQLARLRRYGGTAKVRLDQVYQAFSPTDALSPESAREIIGATTEQIANLAPVQQQDQLPATLTRNYGLSITANNLAGLDHLDTFVAQTGLSVTELQSLFTQNLNAKELFDSSGRFNVTAGKGPTLTLSQDGDRVTGSYGSVGGTVQGVINGLAVHGEWQEGTTTVTRGSFTLTFAADGSGFTGTWTSGPGNTGSSNSWNGTRDGSTPSTAGVIPRSLFVNHVLGPRQHLQIVQGNPSLIQPQSTATLDTVNRFVRLARALGWSWADLNWALTTLTQPAVAGDGTITCATELDSTTIVKLAKVKLLVDDYGLPLPLALALWFDLKTIGRGPDPVSAAPFDAIFNSPSALQQSGGRGVYHPKIAAGPTSYPNPLYGTDPQPWIVQPSTPSAPTLGDLIVASIPASADDITAIAVAAFGANVTVHLDLPTLSVLYRHTQLARQLGLRASSYVRLLDMLGLAPGGKLAPVLGVDDALKVVRAAEWIAASGIQVEEAHYVVTNVANAAAGPSYDPTAVPAFLATLAQVVKSSLATPALFVSPLISSDLSAAIYQLLTNLGYVDPIGVIVKDDSSRSPDFSAISSYRPGTAPLTSDQQQYVLTKLGQQRTEQHGQLYAQLGALFGLSTDLMLTLASGAATWGGQPDPLEPFLLAPLFDAAPGDVLVNGTLNQVLTTKLFATHNITLSADAQVTPLTVTTWQVAGLVNKQTVTYTAVSTDLSAVSFYEVTQAGTSLAFQADGPEVISNHTLDQALVQAFLAKHGVTLDAAPTIKVLVLPLAFTIADPVSGAVYQAIQPGGGANRLSFWGFSAAATATPTVVTSILDLISRFAALRSGLSLSTSATAALVQTPAAFGVDGRQSPRNFTLDVVHAGYRFRQLTSAFHDSTGGLAAYLAAAQRATGAIAALCTVAGWDANACKVLAGQLFGEGVIPGTVDQVDRLNRVFALGTALGVDVYVVQDLYTERAMPATAAGLSNAAGLADRLLQGVRTRTTADAWPARLLDLKGPIDEGRRDALVPMAIWQIGRTYLDITTPRNLYEYLLLDVEMAGCAQISVVKEALNATQLYLQRCRLNLERNVVVSTDDLPNVWWEWLLNYRVWEANRMIFLYPENYVDPSLRNSKTQLFANLENTLLQGQITDASVEAAFRKYLDDLAQIAKLVHIDSYHATVHDRDKGPIDTLFLFSRTDTQPYKFYYAMRQRLGSCTKNTGDVWSEWLPIDITINSSYITPVYVFNRLFIIWIELSHKKDPSDPTDATRRYPITLASIKLSYLNVAGTWVQPQTVTRFHLLLVTTGAVLADVKRVRTGDRGLGPAGAGVLGSAREPAGVRLRGRRDR